MDDSADSFGGATPAGSDPFADLLNAHAASTPTPVPEPSPEAQSPSPQGPDPFADLLEAPESSQTSVGGTLLHGGERSVLPAAAGWAAFGAGAEAGGAAGGAIGGGIGAFFGGIGAAPGAAIGATVGALGGGTLAAFGASAVTEKAQEYGLHALPSDWVDKLGQSDRQQQLEQEYQPVASFIGGLVPYVVTLHPGFGGAAAALPENATAMQRILAHPLTARVFGGAAMGGMEAGQELAQGQKPNWTHVAISTGFGMVFNKPTRIGEALTEAGAAPVRRVLGRPEPVAVAPVPTVAQAGDTKVMGPGITEDVFMGSHEQAPDAAMAAQDSARTETSLIGPEAPGPDLHAVARHLDPETFQRYDALSAQRDDLQAHLASISPAEEEIQATGQGGDTPEMTALRQQIMQTDFAMRDLAPQVAAANRRAADRVGAGIVEPVARETIPEVAPAAPVVAENATTAPAPAAASIQEQAAAIAADVTRRLVAAGRPADEAQASGRLIASHYQARAARFGGVLGTPLELYQAHGPLIRGFGANARVVAPVAKPPLMPTVEQPNFPARAEPLAVAPPPSVSAPVEETPTTAPEISERQKLSIDPVAYAGERTPAVMVGGEMFIGNTHADAIEKAVEQFGQDSAAIRDFESNPEAAIGRLASKNGKSQFGVPFKKGFTADGISGDAGAQIKRILQRPAPNETAPPQQGGAPVANNGIEALDPRSIGVDARRFQFKEGDDESGVTERLQGVEKWDPRLAGTALVWRDETGKNWIADGHQRLALANRLSEGQPDIRLNAFVLNSADGITDEGARAIAAAKNIAEGTGTAIDAAKIIRIAKDKGQDLPPLPPRSALVRDGKALAELSPDAFGMVVNEVVPAAQGAMVGRLVKDPLAQVEAIRLLTLAKPENAQQAEMIVRDMLGSGTEQMTRQDSLFGEEAFASSIVLERAKIADEAIKQLRKDKSTFATLVKEADRIQGAGENVLDQAANTSRLTTDEKASDLLTQLAFRAGPVSDALSAVARRLKSGDIKPAEAAREFLGVVRSAVESGVDTGADVGRPEPSAAGQRQELATEPGAEGLPQTLLPGVAPVTDLERANLEASKPLQGGNAAPGGLFDEDAQNQRELFQPAYHGTPHIFDKFSTEHIGTGEGAQAYGHGLYFAGKKAVAQWYRDKLAGTNKIEFSGGITADDMRAGGAKVRDWFAAHLPDVDFKGADPLNDQTHVMRSFANIYEQRLREGYAANDIPGMIRKQAETTATNRREGGYEVSADHNAKVAEVAAAIEAHPDLVSVSKPGRLYHVDVPDAHELLDWDKPLSEQPEGVKEKIKALGKAVIPPEKTMDGTTVLKWLIDHGMSDAHAWVSDQIEDAVHGGQSASEIAKAIEDEAGTNYKQPLNEDDIQMLKALKGARIGQSEFSLETHGALKGSQFYKLLADKIAPTADGSGLDIAASKALMDAGIPGHQYVGHESQSTNYVIYDDSRVPITNYEQGKNASITFKPGQKPLIKLFETANASSFIHETGHQWLEELMADAKHPAANDILKNDAQTVSDWLGMEEAGAPIKTAQHEKFARGFEQYMREGVAPSPALASVFAKFKSWLTAIYQSIKGLGTPINEDIRGVFDRLLAEEPNRTVIAPEREGAQSLASLHELDALHAHPAEAEPIGDRIAAERDAYVAQQHPEILNELARAEAERAVAAAEPAGEGAAGAAGRPEVGGLGGNANAEPAGGGGGGERGTVQPGGGPSVGEGTGLPNGTGAAAGSAAEPGLRLERPEPAGAARAQPLAPDAGHIFGPEQSPFVDKAGNIRVENLTSSADVAQAIHDAADANNDFIGDRRGVITDGQVMDLADALGMDAAQLSTRRLGQSFNAEQIIAARKLLIQSATDVSALMKKAAVGTDEDVMAYAMAKDRHQMIQGHVAGITAEAGRALRAFRNIAGQETAQGVDQFLRSATGKTLFQLREEAKLGATLDTPAKVSKFVNDARRRTFGQMVLEYWINGLISGPATHTTYMVGNTILALEKAGPETAAAAMIGKLRTMLGREGPTVRMGEVGAQLRGAVSALPMATKAAIDSLRTGVTTRLPGETAKSLPFQPGTEFAPSAMIDESMGYADIAPQVFGMVRGIRDGLISAGSLVSAGGVKGAPLIGLRYSPLGAIPNIAVRGMDVLPLGTAARLPSRFVAAIHSFFRATNYSMAKNALAYRSAAESGKTGEAFDAHVADVRQNPTPEMMEQARSTATQLTLMGQGSEFVQALSRLTNAKILGFPILKFVDPFVHIAGNILDQSLVQRTPLGILSPSLREDLMGRNGTIAQDTAQGRMLVGTMLSIGFGSLAAEGLMSGSGPSDPKQSAMWRLAGNQAHSIKIGDVWYDVHRLGPMGMLAGVAADMYDVAHAAQSGDMLQAASLLQHAFTQNILDESFMSGPAQLIQALEDPGRYGQSYIRNFLSSFVPYSVGMGQLAKASDPYSRQARGFMDAVKNKVPGLSESLMPRRDIWGNEIPNLNAVGGRALSALYMQPVGHDPVNLAMLDLGIYPAAVEKKIRGVLLTDQQYDTYAKMAGRMAKMRLDVIVNSPDFQRWPPSTRVSVIDETIRQSRETARGMIMAQFPSIASAAVQAKLAKLQ